MYPNRLADLGGRVLLGGLFLAGAVQKMVDPSQVEELLAGRGLPPQLIWPALAFNGVAGAMLIADIARRPVALALAAYTVLTSFFHFLPSDGWQMSIFVKNWAIAGGLLVVAAQPGPDGRAGSRAQDGRI